MSVNLKSEKSREYFMVDCLFDEINGHSAHIRFTENEINFIKQLMAEFFNNPKFKLSSRQTEWLENIWKKD